MKSVFIAEAANQEHDGCTALGKKPVRRYQLHLWISEKEYMFLRALAEQEDEPMAMTVRRMIRRWQRTLAQRGGEDAA
jgi:hypothetical protein